MRNESAAEFQRRDQWMQDWAGPYSEWPARGPMEIAFILEALGAPPDSFARVLDLAASLRSGYVPAGLSDVARGYRIGVKPRSQSSGGMPLGVYGDAVILAWTT